MRREKTQVRARRATFMSSPRTLSESAGRMPLVDALRALAATLIVCHHFALYWPTPDGEAPQAADLSGWLWNLRWAVQVFFVIGGYLMAMSLSGRASGSQPLRLVVLRRYCRLMLPYMAAIGVALLACHWGRDWLPEEVVGEPPRAMQVVAHLFLLHDILGYESLAAGVWFLCIDFQLALLYIAMVYVARAVARWRGLDLARPETERFSTDLSLGLGWTLAVASVFYFNLDPNWDPWAMYFFAHFFTGVMVYHALAQPRYRTALAVYFWMLAAGLAYDWRGHLAISLVTGSVLYLAGRAGWLERWPDHPLVRFQARTSYSLFLLHFPVLIVIAAVWERYDWDWRGSTALALVLAYLASVLAAAAFYRTVEVPAARLARRFG